jgi:BlaI family transcriptional regulator, penicillinase repressor
MWRLLRVGSKKRLPPHTYVVVLHTSVVEDKMAEPKLAKLELQIMEALWNHGKASIREIQETFPEKRRPAYTTIQTTVYRLETKNAVRRVKKVGNFHIFEAAVSRNAAQRRLVEDLLALFGGRTQPVMAHLIESGKLTLEDVKEAETVLRKLARKDKSK